VWLGYGYVAASPGFGGCYRGVCNTTLAGLQCGAGTVPRTPATVPMVLGTTGITKIGGIGMFRDFLKDYLPYVGAVFVIFVLLSSLTILAGGWVECRAERGVYVRTAFWMTCVEQGRR
jgi:hypothetical protein